MMMIEVEDDVIKILRVDATIVPLYNFLPNKASEVVVELPR